MQELIRLSRICAIQLPSQVQGGKARKRGSALVFSLMLVGIVTVTGMAMLQLHIARGRRQGQATDNKRAIYIAEAGISEAYLAVAQGRTGNIASEDQPARFANGVYWVEAEDGEDGQVALLSTGLCRTGRFSLSVVVERTYDPIASLGMFGGEQVIVGEGAVIDGFDSRKGDPPLLSTLLASVLNPRGTAVVNSNGPATVESALLNPGYVFGELHPGPGHSVTVEPGSMVSGSTLPRKTVVALPELELPVLTELGDLTIGRGAMLIPAGEYRYGRMGLSRNQKLTIQGPATVVLDHLSIANGGELVVDTTDGVVTLFAAESLRFESGSKVTNVNADSVGFVLLVGAGEPVDIDGDGTLDEAVNFSPAGTYSGFVYAPYTDVVVPSNLHLRGGIVSQSLTLQPGARLSYDAALEDADITLSGLPRLVAWRIVALPDVEIVNLREDPLNKLKRDGITPIRSGDAAKENYVKMDYYDTGGNLQSYSGLATDLDWSVVKAVVRVVWDDDSFVGDEGQPWVRPSRVLNAILGS